MLFKKLKNLFKKKSGIENSGIKTKNQRIGGKIEGKRKC